MFSLYNKNFQNVIKKFSISYRLVHVKRLPLNMPAVNRLAEVYSANAPNSHILTQYVLDNKSIIEILQAQILDIKTPRIHVSNPELCIEFFNEMQKHSKFSLHDLIGVNISTNEYMVHSYLKDELINHFLTITLTDTVKKILKKYGTSFGISSKFYKTFHLVGIKICESIEKNPSIKDFFCDPNFLINPYFLKMIACNCLLGAFLHNIDITVFKNYVDVLDIMVKQLEMFKCCYEHFGVTVNLLHINTNVLPSVEVLRTPFTAVVETVSSISESIPLIPSVVETISSISESIPLIPSVVETVSSISESIPLIPDYLYVNRLVIKKIPFLGDLIFQVVDYCCRGNNYINIAPFVEKTVDLAVKYSLEIGHFFHLFSNIQYTNPNINSLSESSSGDGGDGSDKNPSFNRKVKVIGVFALGFALVVGVAKLFGHN